MQDSLAEGHVVACGSIDEIRYVERTATGAERLPFAVSAGSLLFVTGWAALTPPSATALGTYLVIDDGVPLQVSSGRERSDVAAALGDERFVATGFEGVVSTSHLTIGDHEVRVVIRASDGRSYPVAAGGRFVVEQSLEATVLAASSVRSDSPVKVDASSIDGRRAEEPLACDSQSIVTVSGWAIDAPAQRPASAVFGIVGSVIVRARYGHGRHDVAESLGNAAYVDCGYVLNMPLDRIEPGERLLQIRALSADGTAVFDGPALRLDIMRDAADYGSLIRIETSTEGNIDHTTVIDREGKIRRTGPRVVLRADDTLVLRGWAVDAANDSLARSVHISVSDLPWIPATYGLERPDIAAKIHRPHLVSCGYLALVRASDLPTGTHEATVRVVDRDGRALYETGDRLRFEVVRASS